MLYYTDQVRNSVVKDIDECIDELLSVSASSGISLKTSAKITAYLKTLKELIEEEGNQVCQR